MNEDEWNEAIPAYRQGLNADLVQPMYMGTWGTLFALPLNDLAAARQMAQRLSRTRAEKIRHIRRAILRSNSNGSQQFLIVTELPQKRQWARNLVTLVDVDLHVYLGDEILEALASAF